MTTGGSIEAARTSADSSCRSPFASDTICSAAFEARAGSIRIAQLVMMSENQNTWYAAFAASTTIVPTLRCCRREPTVRSQPHATYAGQ